MNLVAAGALILPPVTLVLARQTQDCLYLRNTASMDGGFEYLGPFADSVDMDSTTFKGHLSIRDTVVPFSRFGDVAHNQMVTHQRRDPLFSKFLKPTSVTSISKQEAEQKYRQIVKLYAQAAFQKKPGAKTEGLTLINELIPIHSSAKDLKNLNTMKKKFDRLE